MTMAARARTLRIGGFLIVALGVVHLVATPFIAAMVRANVQPVTGEWITRPMLLNHIVVALLLFPLGGLTAYAARPAAAGERWALVVVRTATVTIASFLPTLVVIMGLRYSAPLFLLAAAILLIATLVLIAAAFGGERVKRRA